WDKFVELDRAGEDQVPRADVKVRFRGAERDGRGLDAVVAQATAFAVGLLTADDGKATRKVGLLLKETLQRDRLPDVDKAMGWPAGRAAQEADKAIDAADGK